MSITSTVLNDVYSFSGGTLFLTLVLSYMQLYGDFSGGIDIARGVGECFGITITKNFNNPFLSTSLTDYWRRWHISLGAFMKDYVMMPLNLSKPMIKIGKFSREKFGMKIGKLVPVFISTFVVFFLVGIWHGPNLKYLIFGLYNGIITSCETIYKELTNKKQNKNNVFNKVSSHIYALFVMFIANLISYSQDVYGISYSIKSMFTNFTFNTDLLTTLNVNIMYFIVPVVTFFFVILTEQSREGKSDIRQVVAKQNIFVQYLIFIAIIIFILIYSSYASGQGGFAYAAF